MDGQNLAKQTLDQIPRANADAKRIVGLVKEGGRITGYQFALGFAAELNSNRSFTRRRKNARRTFWTTAACNGKIEPSKRKAAMA